MHLFNITREVLIILCNDSLPILQMIIEFPNVTQACDFICISDQFSLNHTEFKFRDVIAYESAFFILWKNGQKR